jgi:hypothetical protein
MPQFYCDEHTKSFLCQNPVEKQTGLTDQQLAQKLHKLMTPNA